LSRRFQQFTSTGGVDEDIALVDVRLLSKPPGMTEADIVDGENAWRLNLLNKLDERGVIHELIGTTGKTDTLVRAVGGTVKKGESLATLPTYFNPLTAFCDAESVAGGTVGLALLLLVDRGVRVVRPTAVALRLPLRQVLGEVDEEAAAPAASRCNHGLKSAGSRLGCTIVFVSRLVSCE
jgi:hypothetical protein